MVSESSLMRAYLFVRSLHARSLIALYVLVKIDVTWRRFRSRLGRVD